MSRLSMSGGVFPLIGYSGLCNSYTLVFCYVFSKRPSISCYGDYGFMCIECMTEACEDLYDRSNGDNK